VQLSGAANGCSPARASIPARWFSRANLVIQPSRKNAIIAGGLRRLAEESRSGNQFDPRPGVRPRAYPLHAFTGDRGFPRGAEYRWTFVENLAVLGWHSGRSWTTVARVSGESPRTGTDFGAGLRFGPSRSANPVLFRLDVAYR
jgi:hypothetical protein